MRLVCRHPLILRSRGGYVRNSVTLIIITLPEKIDMGEWQLFSSYAIRYALPELSPFYMDCVIYSAYAEASLLYERLHSEKLSR